MKVFILAAGLGTRLKPLTDDLPKVMVPVGNKPVLEHLINLCVHHGFREIVLSTHYLPEKISNYFKDGGQFNAHIVYSHEKQMLGSAGALKLAEPLLANDSFFVLNGDVLTNVDLTAMLRFHFQHQGLGTFLVHETDHPFDSDVVVLDKHNRIIKFFRPQTGDRFSPLAKTGAHIFKPQVLGFIPSLQNYSLEKQLIPDLLNKNQPLYGYYSNCYSKDMGTLERLAQAQADYANKQIAF